MNNDTNRKNGQRSTAIVNDRLLLRESSTLTSAQHQSGADGRGQEPLHLRSFRLIEGEIAVSQCRRLFYGSSPLQGMNTQEERSSMQVLQ